MRESTVEKHLVKRAKEAGGVCRKVKWIGQRSAPDRVLMLPGGSVLWVELKAPGRIATAAQKREHERLKAIGQSVVVWDSTKTIDDFFEGL